MQFNLKIGYKLFFIIGLSSLWQPGLKVTAQTLEERPVTQVLSSSFKIQDIYQKTGQLSFNVVRIVNPTDSAVKIKPILILPEKWLVFNSLYQDTIIQAHDSIFLSLRFLIPIQANAETIHKIFFRGYASRDKGLLTECSFEVHPEAFHDWVIGYEQNRVFFYPGLNSAKLDLKVSNNGNVREDIRLQVQNDNRIILNSDRDWKNGIIVSIEPFQDTVITFNLGYNSQVERVYDISKFQVNATAADKSLHRAIMIEKYADTYSPLFIDRGLPHEAEVGIRTFKGNREFLPFVKARGMASFKKKSSLIYNFNYYSLTGREDIIGNSYYNFLYSWQGLKAGLGAFGSRLGRNLYTRNGLMLSNTLQLSPSFSLEAFVCQSLYITKTSAALGYYFSIKKTKFNGSFAYDRDLDKKMNTTSAIFRSGNITLFKKQEINFNLYGYHEAHYPTKSYSLGGIAWDINYFGRFGNRLALQVTNNYGSPDIPGPQMGLLNVNSMITFQLENQRNYFTIRYNYGYRNYYTYSFEGSKLPNIRLKDNYANILYHSNSNPDFTWEAGPSVEFYHSARPSRNEGVTTEFWSQKLRIEMKSVIRRFLTINLKMGLNDARVKDLEEVDERKYDFHLLGAYNMIGGFGVSFTYDYGPMVNSGLYQYPGDVKNHSIAAGPSLMSTYFHDRVLLNLFSNFQYRFDLKYASFNFNPKIETYLFKDWYFVVSGTYHYSHQDYSDYIARNSYTYAEFSIKKRWGKNEFNRWQKDTRRLKIVLFKDDNGNGIRDYGEQGVPFVKTRLILTNSSSPKISAQFPVDIVLLSNEEGVVTFNRLPIGFYDLIIYPLTDMKEYFYVDRGAEKLELIKSSVYFIPFQKATKITGRINVKRQQFIKQGQEEMDLKNIKITAYNKKGNSYSSFTLEDGSFTIFLPGNTEYYVRMPNVFGENFRILNNDLILNVNDTSRNEVVFKVVESSRQIVFKKAQPVQQDTTRPAPLKIKVLHGKLYENPALDTVDINAPPEFHISVAPPQEQIMQTGNYYIVVGGLMDREEAVKLHRILTENGVNAYLGLDEPSGKYYVFTNYYKTETESKKELKRLKDGGINDAKVIMYEK